MVVHYFYYGNRRIIAAMEVRELPWYMATECSWIVPGTITE